MHLSLLISQWEGFNEAYKSSAKDNSFFTHFGFTAKIETKPSKLSLYVYFSSNTKMLQYLTISTNTGEVVFFCILV